MASFCFVLPPKFSVDIHQHKFVLVDLNKQILVVFYPFKINCHFFYGKLTVTLAPGKGIKEK
jgi:hypothetical protein